MNIQTELREHIQVITINRPERKNAVDGPTAQQLFDAFRDFDLNPEAQVAILTGAGNSFCSGADLQAIASNENRNPLETGELGPMGPSRMQLSKPVIAAIEGYAVAGGLELALWCDLRVMSESAVVGVFCRRWGVPLIDGGTIRLPRLIGLSRALDLILTGREVQAEEALQIGLANRVVKEGKALEAAFALAQQIAFFPPNCMKNDRMSVYQQAHLSWEAALENEFRLGLEVIRSKESQQGAQAFLNQK